MIDIIHMIVDEGVGIVILPIVIIMFSLVVRVIMVFKTWYVGEKKFELMIILFAFGIYKILVGSNFLIVLRWEGIGLLSFLLISYWRRNESISASVAAVMYNRAGDVFLLLLLVGLFSPLYAVIAILGKSAMWLGSYWLPIAIEGPTPVSSLLHSSTMVVAGLYLGSIISISLPLLLVLVGSVVLMNNVVLNDVKKIIAFSTATNLVFIGIILSMSLYRVIVVHICVHAFFKASAFIWSGVLIHSNREQNSNSTFSLHILVCIVVLMGLPGIIPGMSKELIVIEIGSAIIMFLLYAVSYTKAFSNGHLLIEGLCTLLSPLLLVVFVIGGLLVMDIGVIILPLLVTAQVVLSFLWR
jgi:NADH-ubiquinone oxidoreductase chain 5